MPDIDVTGGAISALEGGGFLHLDEIKTIEQDNWLTTSFRALKSYIETKIDDRIYELRFGFPSQSEVQHFLPLNKSIIHFEIDNIENVVFGFGENIVNATYDEEERLIHQHEVSCFNVAYDVGIWTSSKAGGSTTRLRAYEILSDALVGPSVFQFVREQIGIEIIGFTGGRFLRENLNDVELFRVVDINLTVRIYARKVRDPVTFVEEFLYDPELDIDEITIEG